MFSASLFAMSEEFWYLIIGHFFKDNKTAKIPWQERSNASISQAPPYNQKNHTKWITILL